MSSQRFLQQHLALVAVALAAALIAANVADYGSAEPGRRTTLSAAATFHNLHFSKLVIFKTDL